MSDDPFPRRVMVVPTHRARHVVQFRPGRDKRYDVLCYELPQVTKLGDVAEVTLGNAADDTADMNTDFVHSLGQIAVSAHRVAVAGTGYVGLTAGACLASLGHEVVCADVDAAKLARLAAGEVDVHEPGLAELVAEGIAAGRLRFVLGAATAVDCFNSGPEFMFLCVPTPIGIDGVVDLSTVDAVVKEVRELLPTECVVVNKSTVPVGTAKRVARLLGRGDVAVVSNPEFLREGSAVSDFLGPDRIVVGGDEQDAERVAALYARLGAPTVLTDAASAELAKYAANCFLATKVSYVNAVAELCERLGADITDVANAMGYDKRIGHAFLSPGPGWGGSCLPKDASALLRIADTADFDFRLLRATIDTNTHQQVRMVEKVRVAITGERTGSLSLVRLGLFGLTFKAGTDDLRGSPSLAVAALLHQAGADLVGYDPALAADTAHLRHLPLPLTVVDEPYLAAKDAEAIVLLTDWPGFRSLDWHRLAEIVRRPVVVDTRNVLDPAIAHRAGFEWIGVGKS